MRSLELDYSTSRKKWSLFLYYVIWMNSLSILVYHYHWIVNTFFQTEDDHMNMLMFVWIAHHFLVPWEQKERFIYFTYALCNMSRILMNCHIYLHIFQIWYNLYTQNVISFCCNSTRCWYKAKQQTNRHL